MFLELSRTFTYANWTHRCISWLRSVQRDDGNAGLRKTRD